MNRNANDSMTEFKHYVNLLRIRQWHKNAFVLLGFVALGDYGNIALLSRVLQCALQFALASSAIYIINDFSDREADARHPVKCNRPLAAGTVAIPVALTLAAMLAVLSVIWASTISYTLPLLIGAYLLNNVLYSIRLKHLPIIEMFQVAIGFMLRILAGTVGVGIAISEWMVLTGFALSLLIGFAKRYAELGAYTNVDQQRHVLRYYSAETLRTFVTIMAAATIMSYALYTLSSRSIELHGHTRLVYTVPLVTFGILRFLYLVEVNGGGEDPASEVLKDRQLLVTLGLWLFAYAYLTG